MGSALLNTISDAEFASGEESAPQAALPGAAAPSGSADALRAEVAERLAAHRRRRGAEAAQSSAAASRPTRPTSTRSAQIAAAVAERYAQTQSYRGFLAAEAERAIQQARAAAEVAAMNAQAVAAAQQRLLEAFDDHADRTASRAVAESAEVPGNKLAGTPEAASHPAATELNLWPDLEPASTQQQKTHHRTRPPAAVNVSRASNPDARTNFEPRASTLEPPAGLTVRPYDDVAGAPHVDFGLTRRNAAARTNRTDERNEAEAHALDEEIAFRHAPVFEEPAGPPVPLPANLIEFPRQLIASRKARPRYAEGPLREEAEASTSDGQLRIFEVDPAQIATSPNANVAEAPEPQWTSIWLDSPSDATQTQDHAEQNYAPSEEMVFGPAALPAPPIQAASIPRRLLATAINATIVLTGTLAFAATFVAISTRGIDWHPDGSRLQVVRSIAASILGQTGLQPAQAAIIVVGAAALLILLYQALFFHFSEATPGMRCARIGLCTFDDNNPTRRAIRRRAFSMLISACPLGLGFVFALLDEDRLTWHDRITKMYLRSY